MRRRIRELVALLAVVPLLAACVSSPPIIRGIELDRRPSATVPLAAQLTFVTDRPTSVVLEIDDGSGLWLIDDEAPEGWSVFRVERLPSLYPLMGQGPRSKAQR